jgi:glycosyltransferase involved in cell wall biosynthesis
MHDAPATSAESPRPALAIMCQTVPPYRQHLHRRLAREVPELRLLTINTHKDKTRDWRLEEDADIGLVNLSAAQTAVGSGESLRARLSITRLRDEWRQGQQAIELLKQNAVAAVIVNGYNDLGRLRVMRWCRQQQIPCFIWGDANICAERLLPTWKKKLKRAVIARVLPLVSGCFGCGRYGVEYWKHYGADPESIFVSPYEPDYALIQNLPEAYVDEVARNHQFDVHRRRMLFSGRMISEKRPDLLVDSFIQLAAERPEWDLVMLGDGPMKTALEARVPAELADRVNWLPFSNNQQEVSALYRACDMLVLPSDYEPWALVINEAVASDMAVVATHVVGAAVEMVVDGENGRLIPPGDQHALREALLDVTHPAHIDRMKGAASECLADWRRRGDPVAGIRQALESVGVLPTS